MIANINGRNPNVFYELGIAHTLDKPTLLVAKTVSDVPFDIRSKRLILYKDENELRDHLQTNLTRVLVEIS